jgi:membrane protease YdiL (CAAX protease family)
MPHRRALPFVLTTLAITWTLQLPGVLARHGVIPGPFERYLLPLGLGALGPLLAAVLVVRREQGAAGVRALVRPLATRGVAAPWYLVALALPGALLVAGFAVYAVLAGRAPTRWVYPPSDAPSVVAAVVFPLGEEVGWRGLALPRLQDRYGALRGSLLVGVAWAVWHLPMFDIAGQTPALVALSVPFFLAGSVVFTWMYNRTRGSLLIAVLLHVGAHLTNSNKPLPADATPAVVHTLAFVVAAALLVALDRKAFRPPFPPVPA